MVRRRRTRTSRPAGPSTPLAVAMKKLTNEALEAVTATGVALAWHLAGTEDDADQDHCNRILLLLMALRVQYSTEITSG